MTSVRDIIIDALQIVGVLGQGAPFEAEMGQQGLLCANQILGQWSLMPLTIPATAREVFPLTAGKGGPSDPYTIGPLGNLDTTRPTFITNVGLYDTTTSQPFEIPRTVYTEDAYASIVQKELTSSYFTGIYYSLTFEAGLGSINLWPVPSAGGTSLVLYRPVQLREFADINDEYDFPPGAVPALSYELAKWLGMRYGRPQSQQLDMMASQFLSVYQRANTMMSDLGMDAALTGQSGVYNIVSDSITSFGGR